MSLPIQANEKRNVYNLKPSDELFVKGWIGRKISLANDFGFKVKLLVATVVMSVASVLCGSFIPATAFAIGSLILVGISSRSSGNRELAFDNWIEEQAAPGNTPEKENLDVSKNTKSIVINLQPEDLKRDGKFYCREKYAHHICLIDIIKSNVTSAVHVYVIDSNYSNWNFHILVNDKAIEMRSPYLL